MLTNDIDVPLDGPQTLAFRAPAAPFRELRVAYEFADNDSLRKLWSAHFPSYSQRRERTRWRVPNATLRTLVTELTSAYQRAPDDDSQLVEQLDGGGLSDDAARWGRARTDFLFPVRVMGALFRGKMLAALERAHARGQIDLGRVDLPALRSKSWIVYAKRPFGGPEHVVRYLGRYTHRVGISNQRLVSMDTHGVTFRTKDGRAVTLAGHELLARFVQHVLPPRFIKIRHYGLHAPSNAKTRLERARLMLAPAQATATSVAPINVLPDDWAALLLRLSGVDVRVCPACQQRAVVRTALASPRCRAPPEDS